MAFKERVFSGVQPTGNLHLGNYLGAIVKFVALQERCDCIYCVVDLHAITVPINVWGGPEELRRNTREVTAAFIASGIDPKKHIVFNQSQVAHHAELAWIFNCVARLGWLNRMTQFKEKAGKDRENASIGLYDYPVLMAADILLYQTDLVPVGEDQIPHLELTREVARKFNQLYCGVDPHTEDKDYQKAGGLLPIIEPKIGRVRRLVGTGAPGPSGELLKMSKSLNNAIFLSDDADTVQKRVMGMYTDPKRIRATDPGEADPAKNPLWAFHEAFNQDKQWVSEQQEAYRAGKVGDVVIKRKLIEILNALIDPIRARRKHFEERPADVMDALKMGTQKAIAVSEETLALAKAAMKQDYYPRTISQA